ncbi:hypothetical protein [Kordiimonas laminariae]|uniref:hypothetical protein n=1 Tax=Kordiimonas laminariae TaxID=2917717 RepID=UPI001FF3F72D|nr:hypothetical protein [Kordiimonas laminariae]MCK0068106.1 hypothetical protein [Kordiimonas laminariae]
MNTLVEHKQPVLPAVCLKKYLLLLTVLGLFIFTRILFSFHHHGMENQFDDTDARLECGYCLVAHAAMDIEDNVQIIALPPFAGNNYDPLHSQIPHSVSISAASARAPPKA